MESHPSIVTGLPQQNMTPAKPFSDPLQLTLQRLYKKSNQISASQPYPNAEGEVYDENLAENTLPHMASVSSSKRDESPPAEEVNED